MGGGGAHPDTVDVKWKDHLRMRLLETSSPRPLHKSVEGREKTEKTALANAGLRLVGKWPIYGDG